MGEYEGSPVSFNWLGLYQANTRSETIQFLFIYLFIYLSINCHHRTRSGPDTYGQTIKIHSVVCVVV